MAFVSVLLPVFNASRYVEQAVLSILDQSHRDFELLVLDDGSQDDSLAILERLASHDPRVRVMSRGNTGIVGALNELIQLARSEWLFRMDADDVARPERLARQLHFVDGNSDCVAVGSRVLFIDPEGSPLQEFVDWFEHSEIERMLMRPSLGIIHPAVAMRRSAVLAVGGYRDQYPFVEDLDLFLRLGEIGRLANVPEVLLEYRNHLSSISHSNATQQSEAAIRAVADACRRRGLPVPADQIQAHIAETPLDLHRKWAWWALTAGHRRTALKHALRVCVEMPYAMRSWHLMASVVKP